jgi:hypothetical protein
MTDRAKFEQMLEYLINEDKSKAEELFHELVVAKSREIYENLLDDDMQVDQQTDEEFDMSEVNDDKAGDALADLDAEEGEEEEEGEGEEEEMDSGEEEPATVGDLDLMKQDIIDALTAEFETMMGDKGDEGDEEGDMDLDMGGEMGPEEPKEEDFVLEYVEKVSPAKMGDNGANTKSPSLNKNTKINSNGAKAVNFSGESNKGGTQGGLANPSTKDLNSGNVNTPGSKNATKLSAQSKGHGAEKKGSGDNGANTKSTIGS